MYNLRKRKRVTEELYKHIFVLDTRAGLSRPVTSPVGNFFRSVYKTFETNKLNNADKCHMKKKTCTHIKTADRNPSYR